MLARRGAWSPCSRNRSHWCFTLRVRSFSEPTASYRSAGQVRQIIIPPAPHLFNYTSGRFLFHEKLRLKERYVRFDVNALLQAIAASVNQPMENITSFVKLREGDDSRIFQATFVDKRQVLAKIPYKTVAKHYAIASEAATLTLLRDYKFTQVPEVLGYAADAKNPVQAEYLLMSKLPGKPLSEVWPDWDDEAREKFAKQIVQLESDIMRLKFIASGSLYFRKDLPKDAETFTRTKATHTRDAIVVGPSAQWHWWVGIRPQLDIHRGPWLKFRKAAMAPGIREVAVCKENKSPMRIRQPWLRELYQQQEFEPKHYRELLNRYLKLSSVISVSATHFLARRRLRHPDLSPENILVDPDSPGKLTGIVDWQGAEILPLGLCAGFPPHTQQCKDPGSLQLNNPNAALPDTWDFLNNSLQESVRHSGKQYISPQLYMKLSKDLNRPHFRALKHSGAMVRPHLYRHVTKPWNGNLLDLQYALVHAYRSWRSLQESRLFGLLDRGNSEVAVRLNRELMRSFRENPCPLQFTDEEVERIQVFREAEAKRNLMVNRALKAIGAGHRGWVRDDRAVWQARALTWRINRGLRLNGSEDFHFKRRNPSANIEIEGLKELQELQELEIEEASLQSQHHFASR
ncbi:kinase-like domain-containing protein [Aspergillus multicolor]|uniref:aminoglycoside phosphotransferase family protein n=1 Tax=Aspergillus multicolor TaxID=41759 RepID=UPI003CCD39AF